jgi:hypothetical protein
MDVYYDMDWLTSDHMLHLILAYSGIIDPIQNMQSGLNVQ